MKVILAISALFFSFHVSVLAAPLRLGADQIFESPYFGWIQGKRVGLITNPSGVNSELETTMDLLNNHPQVNLVALFAPEHGLLGDKQAGETISGEGKIYSLYGETRAPTTEMLEPVEVLIYDIQDVGVRFYTYISTMYLSMKAAAESGIPFIVLDRPDPIGGTRVEGPVLEAGHESFVGIYALPVRYGMTAGELAQMLNQENSLGCQLKIVPLRGWSREQWYDQTELQWIPPSPNLSTLMTATVYPGFCLVEGTNLSEGRGSTRPFEFIGAPWLNNRQLADRLNRLNLPGVRFRPQNFVPSFSKYQGQLCRGLQIHVLDRNLFQPLPTTLHLLAEVYTLHPQKLQFEEDLFDRLAGNSWIRRALLEAQPVERMVTRWKTQLEEFKHKRKKYLLY